MNYLVTARKWRPLVFEDVVGQSHIITTLRNAIATNRLSHAYLFSGPRGVGKTTTARILAKAINCLNPKDFNPDNDCEICKEITDGRSLDVFEIDGASNRGIDEIRNLRESVKYVPSKNKYKVYVIDEVHMLTKEAFNALLKTLEEPPPHIIFVFATTEIHKVPTTILSRCQRYDFKRIGIEEIIKQLKLIADTEKILIDDDALLLIAKKGDGSMRDAQSIFDQIVSFCSDNINASKIIEALGLVDQEIFFKTTDLIRDKDAKGSIDLVEEIINRGYDIKEYLSGLNEHMRNFLIVLTTGSSKLIETSETYKKRYEEDAKNFSETDLLRLIKIITETENSIKWSQQPRFKLEIALVQMIKIDNSVQINQLLNQIDELKKKLDNTFSNSNNEIKVEGRVKASPPTIAHYPKSSQNGSIKTSDNNQKRSLNEPYLLNYTLKSQKQEQLNQDLSSSILFTSQPISLTVEEAAAKWNDVINQATRERVYLGSSLNSSNVIDCSNGHLKIACPDEFHLEFVKKNREYITELAQRIYGIKFRLDPVISNTGVDTSSHTSTIKEKTELKGKQHPVIEALTTKLGAIQINNAEK